MQIKNSASKIKAVIFEALLISGNSAIYHTVTTPQITYTKWIDTILSYIPLVKHIPGLYYFLPYLAAPLLWRYNPAGEQPIWSIDNINSDIPIIIIHSTNDSCLPVAGAYSLYYQLQQKNSQKTFFIERKHDSRHFEILVEGREAQSHIRTILNQALTNNDEIINNTTTTAIYQPEHTQYKNFYTELIKKERIVKKIDLFWYTKCGMVLMIVVYSSLKYKSFFV
ncbi:MAG TPA: hypothetical protein VL201_02180 [Patescibacteria group bacterium]|nr:hypothetical protein [Patescibacteria group bacterium]